MRLNKFIAQATGMSRRAADQAIVDGRVHVNEQVAVLGAAVTDADSVQLDGSELRPPTGEKITILLNKPVGYVCSRNGQGSRTIYDLLPENLHSLKPIGRLDKDSSGLLLMTNDGDLAHELTHPSKQKTKVYEVTLDTPLAPLHQQMISDHGVQLDDGQSQFSVTKIDHPVRSTGGKRSEPGEEQGWHERSSVPPEEVRIASGYPQGNVPVRTSSQQRTSGPAERGLAPPDREPELTNTYKITMHEGRNRQIRRTFEALGYKVTKLHRTHFGPYTLEGIATTRYLAL